MRNEREHISDSIESYFSFSSSLPYNNIIKSALMTASIAIHIFYIISLYSIQLVLHAIIKSLINIPYMFNLFYFSHAILLCMMCVFKYYIIKNSTEHA